MKLKRKKPYPNFETDLKALYGEVLIHGPYIRQDGRAFVIVTLPDGRRITKLYAKFKLEISLGRILNKDETVDHIDENAANDKFSNLRLLSRADNARRSSSARVLDPVKCVLCGSVFVPTRWQVTTRGQKKSGPFCSRRCSGQYGKSVQLGSKKLSREHIQVKYKKPE